MTSVRLCSTSDVITFDALMLSCCKCLFEKIGANLAHIQAENLQNVRKVHFWQKSSVGVNGLIWPKTCRHSHNLTQNFYYFQETYSTFPYSMMTIFVMTLGELNYADTFMPWGKLEYATLTNILFFLFVLGMPIILMNMLVRNV